MIIGSGIALAFILLMLAMFGVFWPLTAFILLFVATWTYLTGWAILWTLWHPIWLAGYFGVAPVWLFFRWTRFVEKSFRRQINKTAKDIIIVPQWGHEWGNFIHCFFYWPVDMAVYVFSDVLKDVWRLVSRIVTDSFDRYAKWRFASLTKKDESGEQL